MKANIIIVLGLKVMALAMGIISVRIFPKRGQQNSELAVLALASLIG